MNKCPRCGKKNPAEIHTCTPLALRLAEKLGFDGTEGEAADELIRLQDINDTLFFALSYVIRDLEMRSNLKLGDEKGEVDIGHGAYMKAKSALAKAKGESNAD